MNAGFGLRFAPDFFFAGRRAAIFFPDFFPDFFAAFFFVAIVYTST
jgi:hypothetical protein